MLALIWNIKQFEKCKVTRHLGMIYESGTPWEKGTVREMAINPKKKCTDEIVWLSHNVIQ